MHASGAPDTAARTPLLRGVQSLCPRLQLGCRIPSPLHVHRTPLTCPCPLHPTPSPWEHLFRGLEGHWGRRKEKETGWRGKGGSEPPKAADTRFLIESRRVGVLGGELTLGRAALLFSIQKICFQFLLSVFGADLDSLGFVCDGAGMGLLAKR